MRTVHTRSEQNLVDKLNLGSGMLGKSTAGT